MTDIGFEVRATLAAVTSPVANSVCVLNQADGKLYAADASGTLQVVSAALNNLAATIAPTVSNDSTQNYSPGSLWWISSTQTLYQCVSAAAGAAVWLMSAMSASPPNIAQKKATTSDFSSGSFVCNGVVAAVPTSSLTAVTGSGFQYNGGLRYPITGSSNTYAINSDTYDFAETTGSITHMAVPNGSLQPVDPSGGVLFQKVVTNGTIITSITPINALGGANALNVASTAIPTTNGLPLCSNSGSNTGVSYQLLSPSAISVSGAVSGQPLVFNGTIYSAGQVSVTTGLATGAAVANQAITFNGSNFAPANGLIGAAAALTSVQTLTNASPSLQAYNSTSAGWTQQLPASVTCPGKVFLFSNYAGSNNIVIAIGTGSGDTVYGVATSRLTLGAHGILGVMADGVNGWHAFASAAIF